MIEKVESKLADVEADLKEGEAKTEAAPTRKVKKVAKKAKKVAKKVAKKSNGAESAGGDKITLADLASRAKITTAAARRKLREAELSREGRWAWEDGSKALKEACKALGIDE